MIIGSEKQINLLAKKYTKNVSQISRTIFVMNCFVFNIRVEIKEQLKFCMSRKDTKNKRSLAHQMKSWSTLIKSSITEYKECV